MKQNTIILVVLVALVAGAAGFVGGVQYQKRQRATFFGPTRDGQGRAAMMGTGNRGDLPAGRQGFRPVAGEIIKADDTSITVKLSDGSSKIVLVSGSTSINKAEQADKEALKEGETVVVFGTENADGSVTAATIQLNPLSRVP